MNIAKIRQRRPLQTFLTLCMLSLGCHALAADVDGDGIDSSSDLDDRNAEIGIPLNIDSAAVPGRYVSIVPGQLSDPGFVTRFVNGVTYNFNSDGTGTLTDPYQEQPFSWAAFSDRIRIVFDQPTSDAGFTKLSVGLLKLMGIADADLADAYIATNGNLQVAVSAQRIQAQMFLASGTVDNGDFFSNESVSFTITDEDLRLQLTGSSNASPTSLDQLVLVSFRDIDLVTDTTLTAAEFDGQIAGPFGVAPNGNLLPGGLVDGVATFNADGTGTLAGTGATFTWAVANNVLTITYADGAVVTIQKSAFADNVVFAELNDQSEIATRYGFLNPVEITETSDFEGTFLLSSYAQTDPSRYSSEGTIRTELVSGWILNTDGTANRIYYENSEPWYWSKSGNDYILTARQDDTGLFAQCELAAAGCTIALQRTITTLTVDDNRVYVLEAQFADPAGDNTPTILPRQHYYVRNFEQDTDLDGSQDVSEVVVGTDPNGPKDIDGDGVLNDLDAFPEDPDETADLDGDGIGDNADTDDDGDGLPDKVEIGNGLDPRNPDDALADLDGDGVSNLDEFTQGTGLEEDLEAPVITVASLIEVASTGRLTPVNLGLTVTDNLDTEPEVTVTPLGPFAPGSYDVTITATDDQLNSTVESLTVNVLPVATVSSKTLAAEGESIAVEFLLNGTAPAYPVVLTYTLSGTASADDVSGATGTATIDAGDSVSIDFDILADTETEGTETLTLTITDASNAEIGTPSQVSIDLSEDNLAPALALSATQNSVASNSVYTDGGPVTVAANATDPNGDVVIYDWSASATTLPIVGGTSSAELVLDPASATTGTVFTATLTAMDDTASPLSTTQSIVLRVAGTTPVLSDALDSDGDGISDANEGLGDADGDGIADYLDAANARNLLQTDADISNGFLLETELGLQISLGRTALSAGAEDASISEDDVANFGGAGGNSGQNTNTELNVVSDVFDFRVSGLPRSGATVGVVLPLSSGIPAGARYQKYFTDLGWSDFVEDANNEILSAPGEPGLCPYPGDTSYVSGLNTGDYCVLLRIQDGGPNDNDGQANGVVEDPGFVGFLTDATAPVLVASDVTLDEPASLLSSDPAFSDFFAGASCTDDIDGVITDISSDAPGAFVVGTNLVTFTCADASGNASEATAELNIVAAAEPVEPPPTRTSSGGGGCSVGTPQGIDPTFYLMLLGAVVYLVRRRKNQAV